MSRWTLLGVIALAGCSLLTFSPAPTVRPGEVLVGEPKIGVAYRIDLYTHCGLRRVDFAGTSWAIHGNLGDGANPPPGFGNAMDAGTITLTSPDEAIYRSQFGAERRLTRGGGLPWVKGCA